MRIYYRNGEILKRLNEDVLSQIFSVLLISRIAINEMAKLALVLLLNEQSKRGPTVRVRPPFAF